jgi:hypothetical protein
MKISFKNVAPAVLAIAFASGCVAETATEREFGDSVRAVTFGQIHDMNAALNADGKAVTGGNGDRLEAVLNTHVGEVVSTQDVQQPVSININSGGNR